MSMPQYWVQSQHYFDILERDGFPAWTQYWIADGDMIDPFPRSALATAFAQWFWDINSTFLLWSSVAQFNDCQIWCNTSAGFMNASESDGNIWLLGDALPQSQCAVMQRWTAGHGRDARGRGYICQLPKIAVADGVLTAGYHDAFQAQWNTLLSPITVGGVHFTQALPSYKNVSLEPITKFVLNYKLGVIHRRARPPYRADPSAGPRRYPQ